MIIEKKYNLDDLTKIYNYNIRDTSCSFSKLLLYLKIELLKNPSERTLKRYELYTDKGFSKLYSLSELYIQFVFFIPNFVLKKPIDVRFNIYDIDTISKKGINSTFEILIPYFFNKMQENNEVTKDIILAPILSDMLFKINEIASVFGFFSELSFSLYDISKLMNRDIVIENVIKNRLSNDLDFSDAENICMDMGDAFKNSIVNDKEDNFMKSFINTGIIKADQLSQMFGAVGPRQNLDTTMNARIIEGGYINGLTTVTELYADSISCRLALLVKYKWLALSGYISRKFDLLTNGTHVVEEDCGSKHYVEQYIKDKKHLRFYDKKFILNKKGDLVSINAERDFHLIGQKILLRSSITCKNDRYKICRKCYGDYETYKLKNPGGLCSITIANPLSNKGMSTKHKTRTSTIVEPVKELLKYFDHDQGVYSILELNSENEIALVFDTQFIRDILVKKGENDSNDDDFILNISNLDNLKLSVNGEIEEINIKNMKLSFNQEFLEEIYKNQKTLLEFDFFTETVKIILNKLNSNTSVFDTIFITEEISRFISMLNDIIERKKDSYYTNYNEMLNDLMEVIYEAELNIVEFSTVEIIVHHLIRDRMDRMNRPDFSKSEVDFVILSLDAAITKSCTSVNSIYQKIKGIYRDIDNFKIKGNKKNDGSYSYLFKGSNKKVFDDISEQEWYKEFIA